MKLTNDQLWQRFQRYYHEFPALGLAVDLSRTHLDEDFFQQMQPRLQKAFTSMDALEAGAIANPDENRMVGHYWLRNPAMAPNPGFRQEIVETVRNVKSFAHQVHNETIQGAYGPFLNLLVIGIGGSALGPQLVANALGHPSEDRMSVYFFDNTDPDGMDTALEALGPELGRTLVLVISKSGGTKETRNGMLEAKAAYESAGLKFAEHAVAVTGAGSELDKVAVGESWLARFPMWDWVGGRTSETSAVGLLPAALQGIDIDEFLAGAAACDEQTRKHSLWENPSAQLAVAWHGIGGGKGSKDMVILPYKDRLELFSRYLQQLIMESLGKELDLDGNQVNQGIAVYGNKGSTDQHAYIQQLRDGLNNFFVTFIHVLLERGRPPLEVEKPNITSGDFLNGFFLGTREALYEKDRQSITLTIQRVDPFHLGVLIALYERAVGFYAALVNVNAYHQPGVEAGKKAAGAVLDLQIRLQAHLTAHPGKFFAIDELARALDAADRTETLFHLCQHLAANGRIKQADGQRALSAQWGAV